MSKELLSMVRELSHMLSESDGGYVSFSDLSDTMGKMLKSHVYVISRHGKILASCTEKKSKIIEEQDDEQRILQEVNDRILALNDIVVNPGREEMDDIFGRDFDPGGRNRLIIPVISGGKRVASLIFSREDPFTEENVAICEYAAAIVGIEVNREDAIEKKNDIRIRNVVIMALDSLSYSELNAVLRVFGEFEGDEILMVTGKVADKFDITKSVIVNALKKLESAGVIETRSLGMKGTRLKIINPYLREELEGISI
jgi:transcriptional pleiotropic repressor